MTETDIDAESKPAPGDAPKARPGWIAWLCSIENAALVACLALMVLLPLAERALRAFAGYFSGASFIARGAEAGTPLR